MKNLNRREALIALGTAVAVPSVAGLAEAASPVVAPQVRNDGHLFIVSGCSDYGGALNPYFRKTPVRDMHETEAAATRFFNEQGMELQHKFYPSNNRMGADYHAAVLRLLDGEPLPQDQVPTDRYYWTVGHTEYGIHLYLSGPGHSAHVPVSHPEYLGRFVILLDGKRYPAQMKYQIEAYPGPGKTEPLVTLVRFDFLPERA